MAAERKYTIAFQTKTELKAVEDTTKAVTEAGNAAEEAGDKFVQAAEDAEKAFKRTKETAKDSSDAFSEAGAEAGQKFNEGAEKGKGKITWTQDLAGAAAEAWQLGTMIGEQIGGAITRIWENGGFSWEALLNLEEAEDAIAQLAVGIEELNRDLAKESAKFWSEYWGNGIKGADEWLSAFKRNMEEAEARFKILDAIQQARDKQKVSQIGSAAAGALSKVATSDMPESQKIEAAAKIEAAKQAQLAEVRKRQRERDIQEAERAARLQEDDVRAKQTAEVKAQDRARAFQQAEENAKRAIKGSGSTDKAITDQIRAQEFERVSQSTGIQVSPDQDARQELQKVKAARLAAEEQLRKLQLEATGKRRVTQIEQETDNQETSAAAARAAEETAARVKQAREKEAAAAKKKEEDDKKALEKAQAEDATKPGSAEADARQVVRQVASSTGNAGAKARLDGLSQDLEDGTASTANLEQLTALAELLRKANNKQNVKMAETLTNALERMLGDINSQEPRIQALEARIEALTRTPVT